MCRKARISSTKVLTARGVSVDGHERSRIDTAPQSIVQIHCISPQIYCCQACCLCIQKHADSRAADALRHKLLAPNWLSNFGKAPKLTFQTCISWPGSLGLPPHGVALALPVTCTTSFNDRQPTFHLRFRPDPSCDFGDAATATMKPNWKLPSHKR